MAAESGADVHHHFAPRCLLRRFDAAAGDLADWSEFDEEAEHWSIEVRGPLPRRPCRADRSLYPRDPSSRPTTSRWITNTSSGRKTMAHSEFLRTAIPA